jgi:predicted ester cyclase
MSVTQQKTIARRFIEEIFNARKTDTAKNFVTPDIIYHGMGEEVKSLEKFKQWVAEDLSAFPDMKITILDALGEQNKVAIRWTLIATHETTLSSLLSIIMIIFSIHAFLPSLVVTAYTEPKEGMQDIDNSIGSHDSIIISPIAYNNNNVFGNIAKQFEYTFD